jgi:hypothetical protein
MAWPGDSSSGNKNSHEPGHSQAPRLVRWLKGSSDSQHRFFTLPRKEEAMKRQSMKTLSLVAAIALVLSLADLVQAGSKTVPHKERTSGQATNIVPPDGDNPGRLDFVASGHATHLGNYIEVGGHDFYPDGTLFGEFESTAANGDTISGIYYGTFQVLEGGIGRFDVTIEWQEGTGRLEGITGIGSAAAILDLATGEFFFDADGTWVKP